MKIMYSNYKILYNKSVMRSKELNNKYNSILSTIWNLLIWKVNYLFRIV